MVRAHLSHGINLCVYVKKTKRVGRGLNHRLGGTAKVNPSPTPHPFSPPSPLSSSTTPSFNPFPVRVDLKGSVAWLCLHPSLTPSCTLLTPSLYPQSSDNPLLQGRDWVILKGKGAINRKDEIIHGQVQVCYAPLFIRGISLAQV